MRSTQGRPSVLSLDSLDMEDIVFSSRLVLPAHQEADFTHKVYTTTYNDTFSSLNMEHGWQKHTHTQEKCARPWRFSLVLDAQCQIERVRMVPSKSSFVFDLDGSLLHKGFSFCVTPSPFYCFLDGSVVDIYFSCCVSTPQFCQTL
jgi:hypothetical protein